MTEKTEQKARKARITMGLAASQARLLSITQRISDNELRAQLINNQKMRLSAESSRVSENYINALNKSNLVFANYDANDNAQNVPLTFNSLTAFNKYNNQYGLTNTAGNVLISENEAKLYEQANGDKEAYLRLHGIEYTTSYWDNIAEQLEKTEQFYSNPDGDDVAEPNAGAAATFNPATGKEINNTTKDGVYDFYNATELKQMYEGDEANGIPSYDTTIKTQLYNDFSNFADEFATVYTAANEAEEQKREALGSLADSLGSSFFTTASLSGTTVTNLTNINNGLATQLNEYFTNVNVADYRITATDISNYFTENGIVFNGTQYTGKLDSEALGMSGSMSSTATTGNPINNLYYSDGSTTYMRIGGDSSDDSSYWIKLPTSVSTSNQSCDRTIYSWNGTAMEAHKDDAGNTISANNVTVRQNGNNYELTLTSTDTDETGGTTTISETYQYSSPNSGGTTANIIYTPANMQAAITEFLQDKCKELFIKCGLENELNTASAGYNALSQELKDALALTVMTTPEITGIIDGLKNTMFKDPSAVNYSAKELWAILNYLTSGVLWPTSNSGTVKLNDGTEDGDFDFKFDDVKPELRDTIHAYALDTVMDIFGEPVYTYLYTNGSGKVDEGSKTDASAEARWFTNLFDKIQKCGYQMLPHGLASSTDWIQFALENGIVVMEQVDSENNWQGITYTSCSDISEQTDSNAATIAEAEYNKAMRQIEAKDEMFDLELKNIDTEHSALQSEYESVKKAMTGNIERTFQMYG